MIKRGPLDLHAREPELTGGGEERPAVRFALSRHGMNHHLFCCHAGLLARKGGERLAGADLEEDEIFLGK